MFQKLIKQFDTESLLKKIIQGKRPYHYALLNRGLSLLVPFNTPHHFKVEKIENERVVVKIPYRRSNLNHLKGIHACAIATLGEICAGVSIIRDFGMKKYRFILANLKIDYKYQGKTDLLGVAVLPQTMITEIHQKLKHEGVSILTIKTEISDTENNHVADVYSTWQLKDWKRTRVKR